MFSEKHNEPQKSVSEMVSEHPTTVHNPPPSAERQRKKSINEAEEIESQFSLLSRVIFIC